MSDAPAQNAGTVIALLKASVAAASGACVRGPENSRAERPLTFLFPGRHGSDMEGDAKGHVGTAEHLLPHGMRPQQILARGLPHQSRCETCGEVLAAHTRPHPLED